MEITGTVTKVIRQVKSHGSVYLRVTLDGEHTLEYLHTFQHLPVKGERVTISGIPMVGYRAVNVGAARVQVHP